MSGSVVCSVLDHRTGCYVSHYSKFMMQEKVHSNYLVQTSSNLAISTPKKPRWMLMFWFLQVMPGEIGGVKFTNIPRADGKSDKKKCQMRMKTGWKLPNVSLPVTSIPTHHIQQAQCLFVLGTHHRRCDIRMRQSNMFKLPVLWSEL